MKKKLLASIAAVTVAASLLAGCGSKEAAETTTKTEASETKAGETEAKDEGTIKIAVAAPMTGDNSEYGLGFYTAAQMKVDEVNAAGGVLGKQVELVQYDDKNSPEEAQTIAQQIASDGDIVGVIGHFASGVCMVAAPIYQENGIIEISPSSSHVDYSVIGDYIFRNNVVIESEARTGLDIAINDLGYKKIGIISIETDWGTNTEAITRKLVEDWGDGVELVASESVVESSDDYSPAITKLDQAGAEVVICVGMYSLDGPVCKQYKAINPDIQIIGFSNTYTENLLSLAGEDAEGMCFPVSFYSGSQEENVKSFVEEFTEKSGAAPSSLTAQAYDSTGILLEAIETAGSTDSEAVRDAVANISYAGVTGQTEFDENGDVQKSLVKMTVKNGEFVLFE